MGRYRNVSILAAAIFFQIVGLAIQVKRQTEDDSTRLIRVWTVEAVTPFEKVFVRVQSSVSGVWHNYFFLRGVRQQNRDLQQQLQQMQIEEVRLRQDAEQARRLQTLLAFKETYIDKTVAAQVIGTSGSDQSRLIYIDKGSNEGIKPDMAVITTSGVVGKVLSVINGSTSQVLLINDQHSGLGTILEQSRLQGVLKGRASGELVLDQIMSEEDVKPGDRVLTSGGDQIFPKGLPVGTVSRVIRGTEFLQVVVQPSAALNHLEEVLVITKEEVHQPASLAANPVRAADILAERLPSVPDAPPGDGTAKPAGVAAKSGAEIKTPGPNSTAATGVVQAGTPVPHKAQPLQDTPANSVATSPKPVAVAKPATVAPAVPAPSGTSLPSSLPKSTVQKPASIPVTPTGPNSDSTQPANGAPPQ